MKARQVFDNHDLFGLVTFRQTIISDISRILIFKMFVGAHIYKLIRRHVTKKKLLHRFSLFLEIITFFQKGGL